VARMRLWHLQTTRGLGGAQGRARSCAQLPATKSLFLGNQEKDFFSQKFCFMGGAKRRREPVCPRCVLGTGAL
jgi:hypothetical protein